MKRLFVMVLLLMFSASRASASEGDEVADDGVDSGCEADCEASGSAEDCEPEIRAIIFSADLTVASTYVFRGALQYPSPVTPSFQPSASLDFSDLMPGSLVFSLWSAFAMSDRERARREGAASEVDIGLTYEHALLRDWLVVGGGFLYYLYPGEEEVDGEKELMLSLGLGNLPVTPSLSFWFEVHPEVGLYIEPAIAWEQVFGGFTVGMDLLMGASIGDGESTIDHSTLTARVSHNVGHLTMGVSISYTLRIAPPGLDFIERSLLWGAVSLSAR